MWKVEFAQDATRDFELIFDHLVAAYQDFGEDPDAALERAALRIRAIQGLAVEIGKAPYQGTLREDLLKGLRFVRRDKAVFWFVPDPDLRVVRVLAVFFGAQNHMTHMLTRLLGTVSSHRPAG